MINRGDSIGDASETRAAYESIAGHDLFVAFISVVRDGNVHGRRAVPLCHSPRSIYLFIYVLILSSIAEYNGQ